MYQYADLARYGCAQVQPGPQLGLARSRRFYSISILAPPAVITLHVTVIIIIHGVVCVSERAHYTQDKLAYTFGMIAPTTGLLRTKERNYFQVGRKTRQGIRKCLAAHFTGASLFSLLTTSAGFFFLRSAQDRESLKNRLHIRVQKSILCSNLVVQRANKR